MGGRGKSKKIKSWEEKRGSGKEQSKQSSRRKQQEQAAVQCSAAANDAGCDCLCGAALLLSQVDLRSTSTVC